MKVKICLFLFSVIFSIHLYGQIGLLKVNESFNLNTIKTIKGELINLDKFQNKVLVMNFWGIGCSGCELERPFLNEIYHKYKGQDVVFLSITMTSKEKLEIFLKTHPIDWKVIGDVDFTGLKGDPTFLINCMPTTILIDKERKIAYSQCNAILEGPTGNQFISVIEKSLEQ